MQLEFDWADVKPSLLSLITVTVMAIVGIVFLKWFVLQFKFVPNSLRELILAV